MEFTKVQMDAMQELANIGAAHSATTLSQMLNTQIDMSVPEMNVVDIAKVGDFISDDLATMVVFDLREIFPMGAI